MSDLPPPALDSAFSPTAPSSPAQQNTGLPEFPPFMEGRTDVQDKVSPDLTRIEAFETDDAGDGAGMRDGDTASNAHPGGGIL